MPIVNEISKSIRKNTTSILTACGLSSMIFSTILAVERTPKVHKIIVEKKKERKLTTVEVVKLSYKHYIPSIIFTSVGIGCIVFANKIHLRRNAALFAAYAVSEKTINSYSRYANKVKGIIGENEHKKIVNEVNGEMASLSTATPGDYVHTGNGNTLCYDMYSDRYFYTSIETLKRKINEINARLLSDVYISLNDFYYEIGLGTFPWGHDLGWNVEDGLIVFTYDSILNPDGIPTLTISFSVPKPNYT